MVGKKKNKKKARRKVVSRKSNSRSKERSQAPEIVGGPSLANPVFLPKPLYVELECNSSAFSHGIGSGHRCFKFIACNGRDCVLVDMLGVQHKVPRSCVSVSKVHGCSWRLSEGYLEVCPVGGEFVVLCPWEVYDPAVPLVADKDLLDVRCRYVRGKETESAFDLGLIDSF